MPFCSECGSKTELKWKCCPMCTSPLKHNKTHSDGTAKVANPYGSASTNTAVNPPPIHNPYATASATAPPAIPRQSRVPAGPPMASNPYHQQIPQSVVHPVPVMVSTSNIRPNPFNQMVHGLAQGINSISSDIAQATAVPVVTPMVIPVANPIVNPMVNPYANHSNNKSVGNGVVKQWTIKRCIRCNGRGRNNFGEQCPSCKGIGSIVVSNTMSCGGCGGRGRSTFDICNMCTGTGFQNVISNPKFPSDFYVKAECKFCSGKGKYGIFGGDTCYICKGAGDVLVFQDNVQCASCHNKGKTPFGDQCVVCKGCGWAFKFEG